MKSRMPTQPLVLKYELDAPPEKVWRAISQPALRKQWLPAEALVGSDPIYSLPGEAIRYPMRDNAPPFLESIVTFQLRPNALGGTTLTITHGLDDPRLVAANDTQSGLMCAA